MTLHTEDEARGKWCPMARVAVMSDNPERGAHNRLIDDEKKLEGRAHCIASDCMAWRWHNANAEEEIGYCGAFGRPE